MNASGTTTEPQDYTFTHQTPSAGVNYYRLKQVDFDGTFAYSKVVAVNAPGNNDIFAFPNPTKDKITVQYDHSKGGANIQLFNALGLLAPFCFFGGWYLFCIDIERFTLIWQPPTTKGRVDWL